MPLRGLSCFSESERDLFFGRQREREELVQLVTAQGFRAGLLYGEAGVGKSSLLRAGLQPDLREQGVVALVCANNSRPLDSFAFALAEATGQSAQQGETAATFLARVICEGSQIYLFILDDIDLEMYEEPRVTTEVAELFTRVASRSAGRARFLFASSSEHVHRFASLEKRTGSLFPPASRYELPRLQPPEALMVFGHIITVAGISCSEEVMRWLVEHLAEGGGVLPVDLQISAMALAAQGVSTAGELQTLGGFAELERRWLSAVASTTGNERSALRLLGELANGPFGTQHALEATARRAGVPTAFAAEALAILQGQGLVCTSTEVVAGTEELQYSLSHEVLGPRVRIITAPATRAAEQVIELLGSKATRSKRLSAKEYLQLRREGIVPSTVQEKAVVDRTLRLGKLAIAAACALPILILLVVYIAMSGSYYLGTSVGNDGNETIVVRTGKPSLSWFYWLPHSPGFGSIVADTGLSERMVSESFWSAASQNELPATADYLEQRKKAQRPRFALLVDYAMRGDGAAITTLHANISDAEGFAQLLSQLRPISQATPEEKQLIATATADTSAAVKTEALMLAAAASTRDESNYGDLLASVLASPDSGQRRPAIAVVRTLDQETADSLYQRALVKELDSTVRHELQALLSVDSKTNAPSTALANAVLLDEDASSETRTRAWAQIERALQRHPAAATTEAIAFLGQDLSAKDQAFLLALLLEHAPKESLVALAPLAESTIRSEELSLRAAGWPLFARVNPQAAAEGLATLHTQEDLPPAMQIAAAQAWGEIARAGDANSDVAKSSIEQLLRSQRRDVRAAAARAYGYVGRSAQATLVKMVKTEFIDVAESAAHGLANSALVNAPIGVAVAGLRDMWKRKGRMRRIATEVFVRIAKSKPGPVYTFLVTASKEESLQALPMRGLCNALRAGHAKAGKDLADAANSSSLEVRRVAIACAADTSLELSNAAAATTRISIAMANDGSDDIRKESALLLAALTKKKHDLARIGPVLSAMTGDSNREVRMIAVAALVTIEELPEQAIEALPDAFRKGEEAEKLLILSVKNAQVATSLVPLAIADSSPLIRTKALDLAIATSTDVNSVLSSSLMDVDATVRRSALKRLTEGEHGLSQVDMDKALALAIRDTDPGISQFAMMTNARLGESARVRSQLSNALASRSETIRAMAAAAILGLVARDPAAALVLLQPLELDPSHDVRVAMLVPLANAYAGVHGVDGVAKLMHASEDRANRRLATAAAFLVMLESEETREAAVAALTGLASEGPPLVGDIAALMLSLHEKSADGLAFLPLLVP